MAYFERPLTCQAKIKAKMSPAFGAVTRASEICRIGGDHPPGTRDRGVPTEESFYDINERRKGRPKNRPRPKKPTSHMLAHRGRNPGTAGSPTEPGTTNRNETVGRNPEATKPGHQEPHDPPTKARHPLDKGASFCPALRRRNHNTKTRNINRTQTEL